MTDAIQKSELIEINSIPAVYANKHYILQNGPLLKIVMCEKSSDAEDIQARAAITMSFNEFFAYADMIQGKRLELEEQMKAFKK